MDRCEHVRAASVGLSVCFHTALSVDAFVQLRTCRCDSLGLSRPAAGRHLWVCGKLYTYT